MALEGEYGLSPFVRGLGADIFALFEHICGTAPDAQLDETVLSVIERAASSVREHLPDDRHHSPIEMTFIFKDFFDSRYDDHVHDRLVLAAQNVYGAEHAVISDICESRSRGVESYQARIRAAIRRLD